MALHHLRKHHDRACFGLEGSQEILIRGVEEQPVAQDQGSMKYAVDLTKTLD